MMVAWMGGLGSEVMMAGASIVRKAQRALGANESTKKFAVAGMRSRHAHNERQGMDRQTLPTHVPVGLTAKRVVGVKKAVATARETVRSWIDFIMVASGEEGKISPRLPVLIVVGGACVHGGEKRWQTRDLTRVGCQRGPSPSAGRSTGAQGRPRPAASQLGKGGP